jgi:predicted metal-dependent RNase
VTALSDGTVPINLHELLRDTTPEEVDRLLARSFLADPVEASIIALLVEDESRRVLVDTGAGELFGPGLGGKLPPGLVAVGCRPEQVDDILITHVRTDHSGCEPTTHLQYVSASPSLSFGPHDPPVHRTDFGRLDALRAGFGHLRHGPSG